MYLQWSCEKGMVCDRRARRRGTFARVLQARSRAPRPSPGAHAGRDRHVHSLALAAPLPVKPGGLHLLVTLLAWPAVTLAQEVLPEPVERTPAAYPLAARLLAREATVELVITVGVDGSVSDAE